MYCRHRGGATVSRHNRKYFVPDIHTRRPWMPNPSVCFVRVESSMMNLYLYLPPLSIKSREKSGFLHGNRYDSANIRKMKSQGDRLFCPQGRAQCIVERVHGERSVRVISSLFTASGATPDRCRLSTAMSQARPYRSASASLLTKEETPCADSPAVLLPARDSA